MAARKGRPQINKKFKDLQRPQEPSQEADPKQAHTDLLRAAKERSSKGTPR